MSEFVDVLPAIAREVGSLELGDARLTARFRTILEAVAKRPAASFPDAMVTNSKTRAFYRFCQNGNITMREMLEPHFHRTAERIGQQQQVLVIHDTTTVTPASATIEGGFYMVSNDTPGLLIHIALALSAPSGLPLGLVDAITVDAPSGHNTPVPDGDKSRRPRSHKIWQDPHKQSQRWWQTLERVAERLPSQAQVVHLMDTEADSFELLHHLQGQRFVVRLKHNRRLSTDEQSHQRLFEALDVAPLFLERHVHMARRRAPVSPKARKAHPEREGRQARLEIRAREVQLDRPRELRHAFEPLGPMYAVAVREIDATEGIEPIAWNLLTSEPVRCAEDAARVVDAYVLRWRVEEYFDVLKNGCALNQRLPESRKTAEGMLAPLLIVAWQLLWLREMERLHERGRPDEVFPKERLHILRKCVPPKMLPPRASVRHVIAALALLGGHQPYNGPPGWRVLARGYLKFLEFEEGWLAAENELCHSKRHNGLGRRGRGRCVP